MANGRSGVLNVAVSSSSTSVVNASSHLQLLRLDQTNKLLVLQFLDRVFPVLGDNQRAKADLQLLFDSVERYNVIGAQYQAYFKRIMDVNTAFALKAQLIRSYLYIQEMMIKKVLHDEHFRLVSMPLRQQIPPPDAKRFSFMRRPSSHSQPMLSPSHVTIRQPNRHPVVTASGDRHEEQNPQMLALPAPSVNPSHAQRIQQDEKSAELKRLVLASKQAIRAIPQRPVFSVGKKFFTGLALMVGVGGSIAAPFTAGTSYIAFSAAAIAVGFFAAIASVAKYAYDYYQHKKAITKYLADHFIKSPTNRLASTRGEVYFLRGYENLLAIVKRSDGRYEVFSRRSQEETYGSKGITEDLRAAIVCVIKQKHNQPALLGETVVSTLVDRQTHGEYPAAEIAPNAAMGNNSSTASMLEAQGGPGVPRMVVHPNVSVVTAAEAASATLDSKYSNEREIQGRNNNELRMRAHR